MGKHLYKKPEPVGVQGICQKCFERPQKKVTPVRYSPLCRYCNNERHNMRKGGKNDRTRYSKHKKETCEQCGFIPEDPCQLDVDHIDNDHSNNDEANLKTLCANCHRLKSKLVEIERAKTKRGPL